MLRVADGNSAALETLYDRYSAAVLGLLIRMVGNRGVAEDLLQEVFWRVWSKADTYNEAKGAYKGWMFSIARRQAIDAGRRQNVRPQAARDEGEERQLMTAPDDTPAIEETAELAWQREKLGKAMETLPDEQRTVLELAYFRGLTRREIADEVGDPLGTVHTRARLGLAKLRTIMVEQAAE